MDLAGGYDAPRESLGVEGQAQGDCFFAGGTFAGIGGGAAAGSSSREQWGEGRRDGGVAWRARPRRARAETQYEYERRWPRGSGCGGVHVVGCCAGSLVVGGNLDRVGSSRARLGGPGPLPWRRARTAHRPEIVDCNHDFQISYNRTRNSCLNSPSPSTRPSHRPTRPVPAKNATALEMHGKTKTTSNHHTAHPQRRPPLFASAPWWPQTGIPPVIPRSMCAASGRVFVKTHSPLRK
jgi:hypothetical protein